MKKIRILQVCGGLSPEGIGVFLLNTMVNIDSSKFEITFALATKYPQTYESRIKAAGGKILRTYEIGEGLAGKIKHFVNLLKIIKKEGSYDVVHSHMDFFNGINLLAAKLGGVNKRISHAHVSKKHVTSIAEYVYHIIMRALIHLCATHKIGCSVKANTNIHGDGFVLFNGIDFSKFSEKYSFPQDLTIDKSMKNLITVGRMDLVKNPFFTLEIISHLSRNNQRFHFYWIGTGSLQSEIRTVAEKYAITDRITFLQNRDDVHEILPAMDLFLFPSFYEGLGMVLTEAQVSGVPCIASDTIPHEVDLGLCKFLSLSRGPEYWADHISASLNKVRSRQLNTLKLKEFDINYMVRKLEHIYHLND